jgi:hypothetical protein
MTAVPTLQAVGTDRSGRGAGRNRWVTNGTTNWVSNGITEMRGES